MSLVLLRIGIALASGVIVYFLTRRLNRTQENQSFSNVGSFDGRNINLCLVCLEEFEPGSTAQIAVLPCNHKFHKTCILEVFRYKEGSKICPCCRRSVRKEFIEKHI